MKTELLSMPKQEAEPEDVAGLYRDVTDGEVVWIISHFMVLTLVAGKKANAIGDVRTADGIKGNRHYKHLRGIHDIRFHCS